MKPIQNLLAAGSAFALLFATPVLHAAEEGAQEEITGTAMCAKCEMKEAPKCVNVLQVTDADGNKKDYYFTENVKHKIFCRGTTENVTAVGTVEEKDGKLYLTAVEVKEPAE